MEEASSPSTADRSGDAGRTQRFGQLVSVIAVRRLDVSADHRGDARALVVRVETDAAGEVRLRIAIHEEHALTSLGERGAEVDDGRGLAHAALAGNACNGYGHLKPGR